MHTSLVRLTLVSMLLALTCVAAVQANVYSDRVRQARAFLEGLDDDPMERLRAAMRSASDALEYERAGVLRDKLQRLESLREQFGRLRFAVESLSFAYIVPGHGGEDRFYLVRRGVIRGEYSAPQTESDWERMRSECARIYSTSGAHVPSSVPAHEVDELLLMTSWFSTKPEELQSTVPVGALGALWGG